MVNSFDDGAGIAAVGALLRRSPAEVRERLYLFGRLPACDPVRAEEDRLLAPAAPPPGIPPQREVTAPVGARMGRSLLGRLLRS